MYPWLLQLAIKLKLKRPPLPSVRAIPVGPSSKKNFVSPDYSLEQLYGDNAITTSRYKYYSFIFQNIGEQAQRIANFYFICIAVIQLFTDTPVTPAISIIPLLFVFAVTMIKQGYEDFLRHKADREVNHARVEIVSEAGKLETVRASELRVGDVILCRSNATFPCDLLLLSSSEQNGECFVTTASLDGETNLKRFVAPESTKIYDSPDLIANELHGTVMCQQPVDDLYAFSGRIVLNHSPNNIETSPLTPSNLLLRGACLRNTDFIYGCAIYTGQDTKVMLNSKGKQTKFSQVERKLNAYLALILAFLVTCAAFSCLLSYVTVSTSYWYTPEHKLSTWMVIQDFLGFIVLYNYIIPISLYVTIEVQKFFGSLFFEWDINLYDPITNEPAKVNTSDLIEEMGQVEYLFTDKTGTLTENLMKFRRLATSSGVYGMFNQRIHTVVPRPSRRVSMINEMDNELGAAIELAPSVSSTPTDSANSTDESDAVRSIHTLLLVLSLCHTVRVEKNLLPEDYGDLKKKKRRKFHPANLGNLVRMKEPPYKGGSALRRASAAQSASAAVRRSRRGRKVAAEDYIYQASSPDEKAFVEASRDLGVIYHGIDEAGLQVITMHGEALRYHLLDVLDFDPTRKCMTVVLQPARIDKYSSSDEPPVLILCKGAETTMLTKVRLSSTIGDLFHPDLLCQSLDGQSPIGMNADDVMEQVTAFASAGLRTLVMGGRVVNPEDWYELKSELDMARGQIEGREEALASVYGKIESQFTIVGCTGIEDMLQDGVPETISSLREAGIQVWVLTGDKEETAVNISYSAGHFYVGMSEVRITKQSSAHQCQSTILYQMERIAEGKKLDKTSTCGIVIDGQSLNYALEPPVRQAFTDCCAEASTVLCCRLTPLQKAEVVKLIKESRSPSPVTAAIGDGANDVSMILEAHIGFGLFGKEGRQASRAADYAFGRFRFLKTALLFHGYTYYTRIAMLVLYFFYKNLLFTLPQMLYGFFCSLSAQSVYPEFYLVIFNITMTSLPIFLFSLFEKPLTIETLFTYPRLYRDIVRNRCLSLWNYFLWIFLAVWHAMFLFFGVYFLSRYGQAGGGSDVSTNYGGSSVGELRGFGNLLVVAIFFVSNLRVFLFSYTINWLIVLFWLLAFVGNLAMFIFLNFYLFPIDTGAELYGTYSALWGGSGAGTGWFGLIVLSVFALLPDFVIRAIHDQGWNWRLAILEKEAAENMSTSEPFNQPSAKFSYDQTENELDAIAKILESPETYSNPSFELGQGDTAPLKIQALFENGPYGRDITVQSASQPRPGSQIAMATMHEIEKTYEASSEPSDDRSSTSHM